MSNGITITAPEERTFRIEVHGDGYRVDGGLGPDSLALGGGRVMVGPVTTGKRPGVFYLTCNSEASVFVLDVPLSNDVVPLDGVFDAPHTCLDEDLPAGVQLPTLRAGVGACLAFVERFPGLDEQLRTAARRDRAAGRGDRVRILAEGHLRALRNPHEPAGSVIPGTGERVRVPTERLADAVERITGDRPRNHVQVRTLMRRWARRQGRRPDGISAHC